MKKEELLEILKERFEKNMEYHKDIKWEDVESKLSKKHIDSLIYMEETMGEPDVIILDGKVVFCDTSKESPKGRVSLCYDEEALNSRKKFKPESSAVTEAENHNIRLLTETEYNYLQTLGDFDLKTSTWLSTPSDIRKLGGAIFGDKRYGRTFVYHNGADSYYSSRGFRAILEI